MVSVVGWSGQNPEAWNSIWHPSCAVETQVFEPSSAGFPDTLAWRGLEMRQPELELVPIWDVTVADGC